MRPRPYKLEFTLTGLPTSTNSMGRKHWAVKVKEANTWKTRVIWTARKAGLPKKPLKKAKLTLIRCSSACPDADGLVSSFKHIIDGLVVAKVLEDDRMENIGMPTYAWERAPQRAGHVKIIVEEEI